MSPTSYPQLRLDADALQRNVHTMAAWCADRGALLAPHVKTTMCEPVFARQVAAGAVGATVATVDQAATVRAWGCRSILIANQVVDDGGLARLRRWLEQDPDLTLRVFVDSAAGVEAAERVFAGGPALEVLVDVGAPGRRTGVRSAEEAGRIAALVARSSALALVGVAGYEGVVPNARDAANLALVDAHCERVRDIYVSTSDLFETDAPVFSMGGSAFPDRVVAFLPADTDVPGTVRLLRSGCYVTHDHGTYLRTSPVPGLLPALTVRTVVLSAPEPGMAVLSAGKRDVPYDAGMPVIVGAQDANGVSLRGAAGTVSALFDHHAVVTGAAGLDVTDVVDLGISHPCGAFDRWSRFVVTRGDGTPIDVWRTEFGRSVDEPETERVP